MTRFEMGPAAATQASARRPPRSIDGLTGVGFAQPMKKPPAQRDATSRMTRGGSRWTMGLSVRRPNSLAVPSPEPVGDQRVAELVDGEADQEEDRHGDDGRRIESEAEHGHSGYGPGPAYRSPGRGGRSRGAGHASRGRAGRRQCRGPLPGGAGPAGRRAARAWLYMVARIAVFFAS